MAFYAIFTNVAQKSQKLSSNIHTSFIFPCYAEASFAVLVVFY